MSKKCAPLWCKAHVKVKSVKNWRHQPFWKLRCRKSARRCGATHSSKSKQSKRTKHTIVGTLLEVEMLKQCAALWREARFQVRMLKRNMLGPLLDIKRFLFLKAGAMDSAPREKWPKRMGFVAFDTDGSAWDIWRMSAKMHFAWQAQYKGHLHQTC